MIGSKPLGEDAGASVVEILGEQAEVGGAIGVCKEDALAVGAALGDVIGLPGQDTALISWHSERIVGTKTRYSPKWQSRLPIS